MERKANSGQQAVICHRLSQVAGHEGRRNDLVYACRPSSAAGAGAARRLVVYFGGDVQDYVECMDAHRDNCRHRQWNLEATARLLLARFGGGDRGSCEVVAVRPRRLAGGTYSVYANFLPGCSELDGQPVFERPFSGASCRALPHLRQLLARARREFAARRIGDSEEGAEAEDEEAAEEAPQEPQRLTLVGFSKGCAPLNQIVRELSHCHGNDKSASQQQQALPGLADIYWLDGGHSGRSDTWLTDPADLACLAWPGLRSRAYATPYQVRDQSRPWIGREFERFQAACADAAAVDHRGGVLCQDLKPSLESHFRLLEVFPAD